MAGGSKPSIAVISGGVTRSESLPNRCGVVGQFGTATLHPMPQHVSPSWLGKDPLA